MHAFLFLLLVVALLHTTEGGSSSRKFYGYGSSARVSLGRPIKRGKWSERISPFLDQVQRHPMTSFTWKIAMKSADDWLTYRIAYCIFKQRLKFSRGKSLQHSHSLQALNATDDNKKFLKAVQLALVKCDMYQHRGWGHLDVFEWTGQKQSNAAVNPELQYLLVTTEFLAQARRLPCEVTAATVAHEFGHLRMHHRKRRMRDVVAVSVLSCSWRAVFKALRRRFNLRLFEWPEFCSFILIGFLNVECGLSNLISQRHEYEADSYAAEAIGEHNMILTLQQSDVPISLINLQHALGVILVPASYFGNSKGSVATLIEQVGGRRSLSFPMRVLILILSGVWVPRFGPISTHPTKEQRMLKLQELKRARRSKEALEVQKRLSFLKL